VIVAVALLIYDASLDRDMFSNWYLVIILVDFVLALVYLERNTRAPATLELGPGSIRIDAEGNPGNPVHRIDLGPTVEVEALLDEVVRSEEYGNLCGWVFRRGDEEVRMSTRDNWELWDLQELRGPVLRLIDHHRMRVGPALEGYLAEHGVEETAKEQEPRRMTTPGRSRPGRKRSLIIEEP